MAHPDELAGVRGGAPNRISLVVGADGCPTGWVLALHEKGQNPELHFVTAFADALDAFPSAAVFAIDIPIGLPEVDSRTADIEARAFIGALCSIVFPAPPTAVLAANDYGEALELARRATSKGISRQAWALLPKIREIAELESDQRLFEVHPEVSFCALAKAPLQASKKTWNGLEERRRLLAKVGLTAPSTAGMAGDRAAPNDILDALAACWSASRIARSEAIRLPGDSTDRTPTIWY